MERKSLHLSILLVVICLLGLMYPQDVSAEEIKVLSHISVVQSPDKRVYGRNEQFDSTGMIVEATYVDGTTEIVTEYQVMSYDNTTLGLKYVWILYNERLTYVEISVIPGKVTNVSATKIENTSHQLTWDVIPEALYYEVYSVDVETGAMTLMSIEIANTLMIEVPDKQVMKYAVLAVVSEYGMVYRSEFSDVYSILPKPDQVINVVLKESTESSITLTWDNVIGATSYIIYRAPIGSIDYKEFATSETNQFTDTNVVSGTSYKYRVAASIVEASNVGEKSIIVKYSTNPGQGVLLSKVGDTKARLTWAAVRGVTSYDIYQVNPEGDDVLVKTLHGNSNRMHLLTGLENGTTYEYYIIAYRNYERVLYPGKPSELVSIVPTVQEKTSTNARYFKKKANFLESSAYKYLDFFQKNAVYSKSFIYPGLHNSEIDGFTSKSMIPQGMTFAKDHLLLTAYDNAGEENSVVYVMDKTTRKYITTVVLPTKGHVGGITYDGHNIWITVGSRLSAFPYEEILKVIESGKTSTIVQFVVHQSVGIQASYVSYYNKMLWVGSYNELENTTMHSFSISDKTKDPKLAKVNTVAMPTRVQGVEFTKDGYLIISRSCQVAAGYRGYMRQLDIHKPLFNQVTEDGLLSIGDVVNTVDMPSMNEEIAISGSYLYVNFESAAFTKASYKVDRVVAFKLSSIIPTTAEIKK